MVVLVLDLKNGTVEEKEWKGEYPGLRCALSLFGEYGPESLVIGSVNPDGKDDGNVRSWNIVYHSEITGKTEISVLSTGHGYSLLRLGIAALVITGRADKLKYITLTPSKREILPIENMRAESSLSFESVVSSLSEVCLSTGVAADKGVWFGSVQYRGRNIGGTGLGHAFFSHNLKGIVMSSFSETTAGKDTDRRASDNTPFSRMIHSYGEYAVIPCSLRLGWTPINNYSDRFDPRVWNMDGRSMAEKFGNYPDGCPGCSLACRRRTRSGASLPGWEDLLMLGPNIGFFDPTNILKIYNAVVAAGLEVPTTAAIVSHILSLSPEERAVYQLKDKSVDSIIAFISRLSTGSILSKGLMSLPDAVQGWDHRPVLFDLRGAFPQALLLSQGLDLVLPATLYFPEKPVSAEVAAVFALYETVYSLALIALGYPVSIESSLYWANVPQLAYRHQFFARFFLRRFTAFGIKGRDLLPLGFEILEKINPQWHPIPSFFTMESESSFDAATVPLKRLQDCYDSEKLRLLISLKSRRDKSVRPEGESSANVAPSEDLGSDAEPGLSK